MILPSNLHEGITIEEAVGGYVADGMPEDRAASLARVLLTDTGDPVI